MPLTPTQLREAERLQRGGLLLREIAAALGVERTAVILGLFGDNVPAVPAGREARSPAPVPAPVPSPAVAEPAPQGALPAPALVPWGRYKLRAPDGQYLHEHARGLTRLPGFFWRGTGAEVERLKTTKPQWAGLIPEEVR